MPNRLADETSPYLLQHQDNPVDWYPWGEEAFAKAREEDKPIFLSIGYSACHWCHVMAHESFEDDATAALMNELFVCIKVDREERPDVDSIYMSAVQAITGGGGWPMSVWMLPDGRPFYGGTYFPDTPRYQMPSFKQILMNISTAYNENRDRLEQDAGSLTESISRRIAVDAEADDNLSLGLLDVGFQDIAKRYDGLWGGFGPKPKFPPSMTIELLLRMYSRNGWDHALEMVTHTLDRMMWGGMYDQVGGGFHRYSVDEMWLIPHFEKMLYDNALLTRAYLYGYQVTGEARYRRIADEIVTYVQREMTSPEGGFYSAQDADSEGHEGKFFVWTEDELREALADLDQVDVVLDYWGVLKGANFEGKSTLWVPDAAEQVAERNKISIDDLFAAVEEAKGILFPIREKRIKPGRDEKILTAWNGLMIKSLAQAGRALGKAEYTELAAGAATFILEKMSDEDGRLLRSYKDGRARFGAYLGDYAFFTEGLIELYQSTFDLRWFKEALRLTELMVDLFWDEEAGFYDTARDHEALITRPQTTSDNAIPSGTSGAVAVLVRMAILADRPEWRVIADRVFSTLISPIQSYPTAFGYLASQFDFAFGKPHEVALVGELDSLADLLEVINEPYRPNQIIVMGSPDDSEAEKLIPLLRDRSLVDGKAAAYVCQSFVCKLPVTEPDALRKELER